MSEAQGGAAGEQEQEGCRTAAAVAVAAGVHLLLQVHAHEPAADAAAQSGCIPALPLAAQGHLGRGDGRP